MRSVFLRIESNKYRKKGKEKSVCLCVYSNIKNVESNKENQRKKIIV